MTPSSSSSDSATDGETGSPVSLSRKHQTLVLVDRLMRYFYEWLDSHTRTCTRGNDDSTSNSNRSLRQAGERSSGVTSSNTASSTKRQREESPENGDSDPDEDDSKGKRPRKPNDVEAPAIGMRKLACPYFKRDPSTYQNWRTCPGPGWGTVHRLK